MLVWCIAIGGLAFTIGIIALAVRFCWTPLARDFPAQDHGPEPIIKYFQSFGVDVMNLGFAMHVAVDDDFLHLKPASAMRLFGMRPISVPWTEVKFVKHRRGGRSSVVKIRGHTVDGPRWCLGLADPEASVDDVT